MVIVVVFGFLKISEAIISNPKIAIGKPFPMPVVLDFGNPTTFSDVINTFRKTSWNVEIVMTKIDVGSYLCELVLDFSGSVKLCLVVRFCLIKITENGKSIA